MSDLIIPRRGFIKGTGIAIASLFVGPALAKYENLMDINRIGNRLVVAYKDYYDNNDTYTLSLFNLNQFITPDDYKAWQENFPTLKYSLQRREQTIDRIGEGGILSKRNVYELAMRKAKESYAKRNTLILT